MNLLWLQGLSCSGNTQSFLCAEDPELWEVLDGYNIVFHPALTYDRDEEGVVRDFLSGGKELDLFLVEGAVGGNERSLCGKPFSRVVRELSERARYVVAVGNCAVFGNVPALMSENVSGLQFRFTERGGLLGKRFRSREGMPVINLSGCPIHPSWLSYMLLSIRHGKDIPLDELGRPKELYSHLTHHGCIRNEYFEWKVEAEEFGRKEGCLFYHLGCRGPMTHASCNRILWNGVSSKTRAGMPCVGCTEYDFPRENRLETQHLMGLPQDLPLGVSKRGYVLISGVAKTFAPERLRKRLIDEDK